MGAPNNMETIGSLVTKMGADTGGLGRELIKSHAQWAKGSLGLTHQLALPAPAVG